MGGRGIGRAICLSLAREGADIVIVARTEKEIRETARLVEKQGGRALAVKTDIRKEEEVIDMVSKAMSAFGRIDILVNNAGVAYRKYLVETSTEEYDEIMDTNVKGMFFCTKYALPHLLKKGRRQSRKYIFRGRKAGHTKIINILRLKICSDRFYRIRCL